MINRAKEIASEVANYLQTAVGEMGHGYETMPGLYGIEDLPPLRQRLARRGDGSLADAFYNDEGLMHDLAGDRIYDAAGDDDNLFNEILSHMPRHINWDDLKRK